MKENRAQLSASYLFVGMLFTVCLITSNLLETKLFHLFGTINLTCGFIVFPISYILNDCISEIWGYRKARLMIWLGFIMNFFVVIMGGVACALPPVDAESNAAFCAIFGFAPQIAFASFLAFLVGSFFNAWIMSKMKFGARHKNNFNWHFSVRAIASTIVGEGIDSVIFFPLAFGLFPLLIDGEAKVSGELLINLMITQVIAKTLFEVFALPITIRVVKFLKKFEGVDVVDEGISYNPMKMFDL